MADERRRRQRAWVVTATLAFAVVVADAFTAVWSLVTGDPWNWDRFWLAAGLIGVNAAVSGGVEALLRPRGQAARHELQPGSAEDDETAQAVRTGQLPPEVDPEEWRRRIRRHNRTAFAVGAYSLTACVAAAVLTAATAHLNSDDDPVLWALVLVLLALPAPFVRLAVGSSRRGRRLLDRL